MRAVVAFDCLVQSPHVGCRKVRCNDQFAGVCRFARTGCEPDLNLQRKGAGLHLDLRTAIGGLDVVPDSDPDKASVRCRFDTKQLFVPLSALPQDTAAAIVPDARFIEPGVDSRKQTLRPSDPQQRKDRLPEVLHRKRITGNHPHRCRLRICGQPECRQTSQRTVAHAGTSVDLDRQPDLLLRNLQPKLSGRRINRQFPVADPAKRIGRKFPCRSLRV